MTYTDKYADYLDSLQKDIAKAKASGKFIAFGYTSNLDILLEWDVDAFNRILKEHLSAVPSAVDGASIGSLEDFVGIVASYLTRGWAARFRSPVPRCAIFWRPPSRAVRPLVVLVLRAVQPLGPWACPL